MNRSPLNYLITIALGAILWVIFAIFIGGAFSESLMLAEATPEDFLANFQIVLGIATICGIVICIYWYYFGGLDSTAGNLGKAKRVWWISFILLIIVSVILLFALVFINLTEGILTKDWLIIYAILSVLTWVFFWISTFLMSPRTVKYIPLLKK